MNRLRGHAVYLLCYLAYAALLLPAVLVVTSQPGPQHAARAEFAGRAWDRPVLESVRQVWDARATGVSEFYFDGVHYVVENLPEEYVAYSSWYCRMP